MTLSEREKLDWMRLLRSERVGPVTFYRLLARYGSAAAALDALPRLARRGGAQEVSLYPTGMAMREIEAADKAGIHIVAACDDAYPPLLKHVEDAPPLLFVRGNPKILQRPAIGMVGTRNASVNGLRIAHRIAEELGAGARVVVSGLARGIDGAAHEGALATGTVAALAGGVDIIYPKEHTDLYERIAEHGALISEMPLGTVPQARHFPRRNRLISGTSEGIVVVEAAPRSGSLITARLALEQNREVFAVPGSPLDPRSRGTNDLIRQGAHLTESAEDIFNFLSGPLRQNLDRPQHIEIKSEIDVSRDDDDTVEERDRVLNSLGTAPVEVDELIRRCQMSPTAVSTVLLELELAGKLERHPGNQVSIIAEF